MTDQDLASFTTDMTNYAVHTAAMGGTLWSFGIYGKMGCLEKKAPVIEDLLRNEQLWKICIRYMPMAKTRDYYVSS
eukprot:9412254-Lingulodinium_polyedra.AAC.2